METVLVRYENNSLKKWDGKEKAIAVEMLVRMGKRGADGLERGEVHWPGKGGKGTMWNCVILAEGNAIAEEGTQAKRRQTAVHSVMPSRPWPGPGIGKSPRTSPQDQPSQPGKSPLLQTPQQKPCGKGKYMYIYMYSAFMYMYVYVA